MEGAPCLVVGLEAVGGEGGAWRMGRGHGVWESWGAVGCRWELAVEGCRQGLGGGGAVGRRC